MQYVNQMGMQTDKAAGIVRMVFNQVRPNPSVAPPDTSVVADLVMPIGMAHEVFKVMAKELGAEVPELQNVIDDLKEAGLKSTR